MHAAATVVTTGQGLVQDRKIGIVQATFLQFDY